jgi:hypothetical protein
MSLRFKHIDEAHRRAAAELASRKVTCEGCFFLQRHPRPMCKGEDSPHFRTVRDTYHERCHAFSVSKPEPRPPEPRARKPASSHLRSRAQR